MGKLVIVDGVSTWLVDRGHSVGTEHPFLQRDVLPVLILLRIRIWNLNDIILNILLQVLFRTHITILLHLRRANGSTRRAYRHSIQTLAANASDEAVGSFLTHSYATNSRMNPVLASARPTSLRLPWSSTIWLHHKVVIHMVEYLGLLTILGADFVVNRDWGNSIIRTLGVHFEYIIGVVLIVVIDI